MIMAKLKISRTPMDVVKLRHMKVGAAFLKPGGSAQHWSEELDRGDIDWSPRRKPAPGLILSKIMRVQCRPSCHGDKAYHLFILKG